MMQICSNLGMAVNKGLISELIKMLYQCNVTYIIGFVTYYHHMKTIFQEKHKCWLFNKRLTIMMITGLNEDYFSIFRFKIGFAPRILQYLCNSILLTRKQTKTVSYGCQQQVLLPLFDNFRLYIVKMTFFFYCGNDVERARLNLNLKLVTCGHRPVHSCRFSLVNRRTDQS